MKLWVKNTILLLIAIVICTVPLLIINGAEFSGADSLAQEAITQIAPTYKPWAESLITPASSEIESLLFALQAALGAGIVGFVLGRLTTPAKR